MNKKNANFMKQITGTYKQVLTDKEIKDLKKNKKFKFNNDVSIRSICNHVDNGVDVVTMVNDGSEDVYCPICKDRWNPNLEKTDKNINYAINNIINDIKNIKWCTNTNRKTIKKLAILINLLQQYSDFRKENINKLKFDNNKMIGEVLPYNGIFYGERVPNDIVYGDKLPYGEGVPYNGIVYGNIPYSMYTKDKSKKKGESKKKKSE